jgi:hypothetical protein
MLSPWDLESWRNSGLALFSFKTNACAFFSLLCPTESRRRGACKWRTDNFEFLNKYVTNENERWANTLRKVTIKQLSVICDIKYFISLRCNYVSHSTLSEIWAASLIRTQRLRLLLHYFYWYSSYPSSLYTLYVGLLAAKPFGNGATLTFCVTITNENCFHVEIKSRLNSGNACYHAVQKLLSSRLLPENIKTEYTKL